MKRLLLFVLLVCTFNVSSAYALTLEAALELARRHHPSLTVAKANAGIIAAESSLAVRLPNPELEMEVEGIGGSREYTALVQMDIQRPAKSRHRKSAARYSMEASKLSVEIARRDLEVAVGRSYLEALAQQEFLEVRRQQVALSRDILKTAKAKHEAGAMSELDVVLAEIAVENAGIEEANQAESLAASRNSLARLIGIKFPMPGILSENFFQPLEHRDEADASDARTLEVARHTLLMRQAEAELDATRMDAAAGFTFGAGVRHDEDSNENTLLLTASLPLPIITRSKHHRGPAPWRMESLHAEASAIRMDADQLLDDLQSSFRISAMQVERIRDRLLPMAERVYSISREGHEAGRRSWLELLEARQSLADIKIRYIEAQRAMLVAAFELRMLTERPSVSPPQAREGFQYFPPDYGAPTGGHHR